MRTLRINRLPLRQLVAMVAMLAITVALGAVSATQAVGAGAKMTIHISSKAGPIFGYDGSVLGTGPVLPATSVHAVIRNCPDGEYRLSAALVQDGVEANWATSARGAGDTICHDADKVIDTGMAFYSPTLHSGVATATFALQTMEGEMLGEVTRQVRIP